MHLHKNCLRYLVPFSVEMGFDQACAVVDGCSAPVWQRVYARTLQDLGDEPGRCCESDLYSSVGNEFCWEQQTQAWSNKMGHTWRSQDPGTLPGRLRYVAEPKKLLQEGSHPYIEFELTQMGLTLFRNGLGFFWYEISVCKEMTALELQEFQNQVKELNRGEMAKIWQVSKTEPMAGLRYQKVVNGPKKHVIPTEYLIPFSLGQWVAQLLRGLEPAFLPDRANAYATMMKHSLVAVSETMLTGNYETMLQNMVLPARVPDKAVLFTYAAFEASKEPVAVTEDHRQLAYHISNGYKSSYRYSKEQEQQMLSPFSNALWYMSKEGCGYLAWPDEENKDFFYGTLVTKIQNDYFTLFLKGMFQSYSLLLYSQKIQSRLSAVAEDYLVSKDNTVIEALTDEMEHLICEINVFLSKGMETSVSHIDHQNRFYCHWIQCLRIHDEVKSVTAGLDALEDLQREQHKREDKRRDQRLNFLLNVAAVLGAILTFSNLLELLFQVMPTRGLAWGGLAGIAAMVWWMVRRMQK